MRVNRPTCAARGPVKGKQSRGLGMVVGRDPHRMSTVPMLCGAAACRLGMIRSRMSRYKSWGLLRRCGAPAIPFEAFAFECALSGGGRLRRQLPAGGIPTL